MKGFLSTFKVVQKCFNSSGVGQCLDHNVWKGLAFVQNLNGTCLQGFLAVIAFYLVAQETCEKKGAIAWWLKIYFLESDSLHQKISVSCVTLSSYLTS